jgi:O-antigen/teichoic acid export membrane protein
MGLVAAWTLQTMVARGVALVILHRRYPWLRTKVGVPSWEIFSRMAGPSIRWAIIGLGAILILYSSNVVIAARLGPGAIPPYEAVARIVMTLMTVSLYIVTSSTPFISAAYAASNSASVISLIMRNMRVSMWTVAVLSAYVAIFCEEIIRVWLGPEFFPGWNVVWTLLVMVILETHHVTLAAATMASGRVVFAHVAVIAGVLNIALALVLVEVLGLWALRWR